MKKRNIIRIISFLTAGLLVTSGLFLKNFQKAKKLSLAIQNNYSHSLNELTASVNNISSLLKKAKYINQAGHLGETAIELLTEAEISKNALAQLPSNSNLEVLNRFLSQVGNYAVSASKTALENKKFPEKYNDTIEVLSNTAEKISSAVRDAYINFDNVDYWADELNNKISNEVDNTLSASLTDLESELTDYPTLIYDGPYSDHILSQKPLVVENESEVSLSKAQQIATEFCQENIEFKAEENGKIPVFRFSGENTDITVSKAGGHIVYMRKTKTAQNYILNYNQAISKAKQFLDKNNLTNFKETYYFTDEGVCVINFAFVDGQTICYTDLIKVGVSLESGEIVFYEASGYLSNHKERAFETPEFTLEVAKEAVSNRLEIKKTALALIPIDTAEKRCYEFTCNDGDQEILVYINVMTLDEEEILILLKSDGGILAK